MSDFDDGPASLSSSTGLDDGHGTSHTEFPHDTELTHKPTDPSFDPFSTQTLPPTTHNDVEAPAYFAHRTEDGEHREFPTHPSEPFKTSDDDHDDLPANFSRAPPPKNQELSDPLGDEPDYCNQGRGDEVAELNEGVTSQGLSSNPFPSEHEESPITEDDVQGRVEDYHQDRPIMGYNPFLQEESEQTQPHAEERDDSDSEELNDTRRIPSDEIQDSYQEQQELEASQQLLQEEEQQTAFDQGPTNQESSVFDQAPMRHASHENHEEETTTGYHRLDDNDVGDGDDGDDDDDDDDDEEDEEEDSTDLQMDPVTEHVHSIEEQQPILSAPPSQITEEPSPQEPPREPLKTEDHEHMDVEQEEEVAFHDRTDEQHSQEPEQSIPATDFVEEPPMSDQVQEPFQTETMDVEEENKAPLELSSDDFLQQEEKVTHEQEVPQIEMSQNQDADLPVQSDDVDEHDTMSQQPEIEQTFDDNRFHGDHVSAQPQAELTHFEEEKIEEKGEILAGAVDTIVGQKEERNQSEISDEDEEQPFESREEEIIEARTIDQVEASPAPTQCTEGKDEPMEQEEKQEVEQEQIEQQVEETLESTKIDEVETAPAPVQFDDEEENEIVEKDEFIDERKTVEDNDKMEEEKVETIEAEHIQPSVTEDYSSDLKEESIKTDYEKEENIDSLQTADLADSPVSSSKHEEILQGETRCFTESLSGRESPIVPQPLPSPPSPREGDLMSPFDPLAPQLAESDSGFGAPAPSDATGPIELQAEENLGQARDDSFTKPVVCDPGYPEDDFSKLSGFDPGVVSNGMETESTGLAQEEIKNISENGDFLTAGEVEGETRFDMDGSAVTSTNIAAESAQHDGNQFVNSEEEEEEEEERSQTMDAHAAPSTTETETSAEDRSAVEDSGEVTTGTESDPVAQEANDNALMSMSMEGSFYDDGGELMGGEDGRNGDAAQPDPITEETSSYEGFTPKQDSFLTDQDNFSQLQNDLVQNQAPPVVEDSAHHEEFVSQHHQEPIVNGGFEENKENTFDSLMDAPVSAAGLQTPVTEQSQSVDTSVDKYGVDSLVQEFDSSVDTAPPPQQPANVDLMGGTNDNALICDPSMINQANHSAQDFDNAFGNVGQSSEAAPAKPDEPSSSVDEIISQVAETNAAAAAATAEEPTAAATPATAAATATSKTTTKSTIAKKSTTKSSSAKTTTATTTTKVSKETKSAPPGKPATTIKKSETTTAKTSTTPKKPSERPSSAKTTPKPGSGSGSASPTKPNKPLPSYAQPITPRKPREPKFDEKPKKTPTPRTSSANRPSSASTTPRPASSTTSPRTPRPTSATRPTSSTSSSVSKSTTRTSTTTTASATRTSTTRTSSATRPKSSPTKLPNGTAKTDSSPTTKKYGIDSRNDNYKPGGGNARTTPRTTPRTDTGAKGSTPTAGARSPTKSPATPRTPGGSKTEVKSKIGSLNNTTHTPGGGAVRIVSKKTDYSNVSSRIGSKDKIDHKPGGGNIRIESRKLKVEAKSKVGSLDNASHKPTGGDKKIETKKLDWKVESRIGSLDNAKHVAGGGDKKIEVQKTEWKAQSKIGSLENAKHTPGGGDKKIESHKLEFKEKASPKVGTLDKVRLNSRGSDEGEVQELQQTEAVATNGASEN